MQGLQAKATCSPFFMLEFVYGNGRG